MQFHCIRGLSLKILNLTVNVKLTFLKFASFTAKHHTLLLSLSVMLGTLDSINDIHNVWAEEMN